MRGDGAVLHPSKWLSVPSSPACLEVCAQSEAPTHLCVLWPAQLGGHRQRLGDGDVASPLAHYTPRGPGSPKQEECRSSPSLVHLYFKAQAKYRSAACPHQGCQWGFGTVVRSCMWYQPWNELLLLLGAWCLYSQLPGVPEVPCPVSVLLSKLFKSWTCLGGNPLKWKEKAMGRSVKRWMFCLQMYGRSYHENTGWTVLSKWVCYSAG